MLDIYCKDSLYGREKVFERIDEVDAELDREEDGRDGQYDKEKHVKLLYEKMIRSLWLQYLPNRY